MTRVRRLVSTVERTLLEGWARASNDAAVANARTATTQCCRRRLERVEVAAYLAGLAGGAERAVTTTTPSARTARAASAAR